MNSIKETLQHRIILFKEAVRSITFSSSRAIEDDIQSIDLDVFSQWADELSFASLRDPDGKERARSIYLTLDGKVLVSNNIFIGHTMANGKAVEVPNESVRNSAKIWLKKLVTVMHSHGGLDHPPSPIDIVPLLLENSDPNSETCTFIASVSRKILVFRTPKTPVLSQELIDQVVKEWRKEITNAVRTYGLLSPSAKVKVEKKVQEKILEKYIAKFNLALFIGGEEESIAQRCSTFTDSETSQLSGLEKTVTQAVHRLRQIIASRIKI